MTERSSGDGITVKFCVSADTDKNNHIMVLGNHPALGTWNVDYGLLLDYDKANGTWTGTVKLNIGTIRYRFLLVKLSSAGNTRHKIITKWEGHYQPRCLELLESMGASDIVVTASLGDIESNLSVIDDGWLNGETEVQLRFYGDALQLWTTSIPQTIRIKCTTQPRLFVDESGDKDKPSSQLPFYVVDLHNPLSRFTTQHNDGECFTSDQYIVFRTQSLEHKFLVIKIEVIDDMSRNVIAVAHLLPVHLSLSQSNHTVPLIDESLVSIGSIDVDVLIIKPINIPPSVLNTSFLHFWPYSHPIQIGHRGLGSTFGVESRSQITENTCESFAKAAEMRAKFVEFDVHLTKDKVPIVYHDFHVCACFDKKNTGDGDHNGFIQLSVKELTLSQLHTLKLYHTNQKELTGNDTLSRSFPTLQSLFENLDKDLGFDIELKYPMEYKNGEVEDINPFDVNEFVDVILADVFTHAAARHCIFSCFHPDICILLRRKQSVYPVYFLTSCALDKYTPYMDSRTYSLARAIALCNAYNMKGIVPETSAILSDPECILRLKELGLMCFSFGSENNDRTMINKLKAYGLDGIIHDGIDVLQPE